MEADALTPHSPTCPSPGGAGRNQNQGPAHPNATVQCAQQEPSFDFDKHRNSAVSAYLEVQQFYTDLAAATARIIEECLKKRKIKVHSVQHRAKDPNSFGCKAALPAEDDPDKPRYTDPIKEITDLAGVRVIAHFPATIRDIDQLLDDEFDIIERSDKGQELVDEDRFGYQSVHYLLRLSVHRAELAEYERFATAIAEVQVRTILQHAWAEIEHDIQYKSSVSIPAVIHRRFTALAGMLEIADREFQAVHDADVELTAQARKSVSRGELTGIEITPDALKLFLDKTLGPDGRISESEYDWLTRLLKRLGFRDLKQVEEAVQPYDDTTLNNIVWSARQGQASRFELMLLAALGQQFIQRHIFAAHAWFSTTWLRHLESFRSSGIQTGSYDPAAPRPNPQVTPQSAPPRQP